MEDITTDKFEKDLNVLIGRLSEKSDEDTMEKVNELRNRLVTLHENNLVKINHSVMELVCARYLILRGYEVDVEHLLDGLSCDLYGEKGLGNLVVEIETGFIPPEHALKPLTYCRSRIASKIARYSSYTNKFCLGIPSHYIMQIPSVLVKPPRFRDEEEVSEVKDLCDLYYSNPPVSMEDIRNARLHAIYTLDVDKSTVKETDPEEYITSY